jgi:hypothetical protein
VQYENQHALVLVQPLRGMSCLGKPPLWWFHRWKMRICGGTQSMAVFRVVFLGVLLSIVCYATETDSRSCVYC